MSLGSEKLSLVQTVDKRINVEKLTRLLYNVETVGSSNTYQRFDTTSYSPSGFTIVCNPPSRFVGVMPKFYLNIQFTLTFNGTSGAPGITLLQCPYLPTILPNPLANGNTMTYDAPRAYPLSNSLSNLQVSINGDTISTNLNEYYRVLTHYYKDVCCEDSWDSQTPSMLDQSQQYSDLNGFARNPLNGYGANFEQVPRGGYIGANVITNSSTGLPGDQAIVRLNVIEPCYLSPLDQSCGFNQPCFFGLDDITIVGTFNGRGNTSQGALIAALWSHMFQPTTPSVFSSFNVVVDSAAAFFQYITPPMDLQIPRTLVYPYTQPIYYSTTQNSAVNAGADMQLNLSNVQLNSVPDRVYLWVTVRDQDVTLGSTDTFFGPQINANNFSAGASPINITFNNVAGVLSTAQTSDVYNMCLKNGLKDLAYRQFVRDVGMPICLVFGEDIALPDLVVAGSRGSYNISITMNVRNNYNVAVIPTIAALFIHTGTFSIEEGQCKRQLGILTQQDVLKTKQSKEIPRDSPPVDNALGGFSWDDLFSFLKRGARTALNIGKVAVPLLAPEFAPGVAIADNLARAVGVGKVRGGKRMTRAEMMKRMR